MGGRKTDSVEQMVGQFATPLGVWWWREVLIENGLRAPRLGELAVASAGGLADGLQGYSQQDGKAELAAWTAVRGSEGAARQIAALLADPDVGRRQLSLVVLADLPDAESAVRPLLDDPVARPYARMWLARPRRVADLRGGRSAREGLVALR